MARGQLKPRMEGGRDSIKGCCCCIIISPTSKALHGLLKSTQAGTYPHWGGLGASVPQEVLQLSPRYSGSCS